MAETNDELQTRVCRACNLPYEYPVLKSRATRFYCATCAELPENVRVVIERLNKRLRELERKAAPKPPPAKTNA